MTGEKGMKKLLILLVMFSGLTMAEAEKNAPQATKSDEQQALQQPADPILMQLESIRTDLNLIKNKEEKQDYIKDWIPLIGVIIGAVVGFLSGWLTNKSQRKNLEQQIEHQEKSDARTIRRERLERLFVLTDELNDLTTRKHLMLLNAVEKQLPYENLLTAIQSLPTNDPLPHIYALVSLYFNDDMFSSYQKLANCTEGFREIEKEIHQSYFNGDIPSKDFTISLNQAFQVMPENIIEFRRDIVPCVDPIYKCK